MTIPQQQTITYVMKDYGFGSVPDMIYLTDAELRFTPEEIEKCQNVQTTAMTTSEASEFLTLTRNIATWREQVGTGMCDQWIKRVKKMIAKW